MSDQVTLLSQIGTDYPCVPCNIYYTREIIQHVKLHNDAAHGEMINCLRHVDGRTICILVTGGYIHAGFYHDLFALDEDDLINWRFDRYTRYGDIIDRPDLYKLSNIIKPGLRILKMHGKTISPKEMVADYRLYEQEFMDCGFTCLLGFVFNHAKMIDCSVLINRPKRLLYNLYQYSCDYVGYETIDDLSKTADDLDNWIFARRQTDTKYVLIPDGGIYNIV